MLIDAISSRVVRVRSRILWLVLLRQASDLGGRLQFFFSRFFGLEGLGW